jgi:glycosyltransferase involved in cell wall biosynthesis
MVVVEAMMAGRPVITSRVCPALEYVGDAAIEVQPDDQGAYYEAIVRLKSNRQLYEGLRASCGSMTKRFSDPSQGYGAAVRHVLEALGRGRRPEPRELHP